MAALLIIDNYDSFTYNLVQLLGEMTADLEVVRNDVLTWQEVGDRRPKGIVISPGPGNPDEAGVSLDVIRQLGVSIPILGVCLGHQAIGQAFGARVVRGREPVHGKTSAIMHDGLALFEGVSNPFEATRYHSLVIARETLPPELAVTAWTDDGVIMGVAHRERPIAGVQFHPESILTSEGRKLLGNFVRGLGIPVATHGGAS